MFRVKAGQGESTYGVLGLDERIVDSHNVNVIVLDAGKCSLEARLADAGKGFYSRISVDLVQSQCELQCWRLATLTILPIRPKPLIPTETGMMISRKLEKCCAKED
jgi:hypothetical protein